MNALQAQKIKDLREKTQANITLIRQALLACGDDVQRAEQYIAEHAKPAKDAGQGAGLIVADTWQDRIGALVEVRCGTDFVARTDEFRALCRELLLQAIAGIGDGPLHEQDHFRNPSCKVSALVEECARKVGEQITVRRFVRWEL